MTASEASPPCPFFVFDSSVGGRMLTRSLMRHLCRDVGRVFVSLSGRTAECSKFVSLPSSEICPVFEVHVRFLPLLTDVFSAHTRKESRMLFLMRCFCFQSQHKLNSTHLHCIGGRRKSQMSQNLDRYNAIQYNS